MTNTTNNIREAGIVLINKNSEKVLVVLQSASKKWGLPKGQTENTDFECHYKTAERELFEETSILLTLNKHKLLFNYKVNDKIYYVVKIFNNIPFPKPQDNEEISDVKWIEIDQLDNFIKNNECNRSLRILNDKINNKSIYLKLPDKKQKSEKDESWTATKIRNSLKL